MICGSKIKRENIAMTNGGGCGGVYGVYNCIGSDGVKVRDDGVAVWKGVAVDVEVNKTCCWYWK